LAGDVDVVREIGEDVEQRAVPRERDGHGLAAELREGAIDRGLRLAEKDFELPDADEEA
jgi:hypothetical protein